MKLINKLKDLFIDVEETEEEEEEENIVPIEVKTKKEEKEVVAPPKIESKEEARFKLPKVMRDSIESENNNKEDVLKLNEDIKPRNDDYREMVPRSRSSMHNYNFDIDFEKVSNSNQNILNIEREKEKPKKVADLYADPKKDKAKQEVKEKKFAPSPVISPVYGVLDKNYKTDELLSKSESSYEMQRHSKKIDFESVRRKAFGNLSDDIRNNLCEDCELFKEVKRLEKLNEEELLYDMTTEESTDSHSKNADTIEEAYDNYSDFGIEYNTNNNEVIDVKPEEEKEVKIVNHTDTYAESEKIEIKEQEKKEDNLDTKLSDDLFDLIDSMYKEGDD